MISRFMRSLVFSVRPARWVGCKIFGLAWKNCYLSRLGGLALREMAVPELPDGDWVRCRTLLGGICGTDINMVYMQQHPASILRSFVSMPVMMGHENVSLIDTSGSDVRDFRVGQRVIVDPPIPCSARKIREVCPACRVGKPSICNNFDLGSLPPAMGLGYNNFTGGSWSPYFVAHASQVHSLPEEISDEQAILIDPLACSLHSILQDSPKPDEHVLIFGAGIISMGIIMGLRALELPVKITATVRHAYQADLARRCGADQVVFWSKNKIAGAMDELAGISGSRSLRGPVGMRFLQGGFDRVYDCTGKIPGLVESQRLVRAGGTLVVAGTPQLGLADLTCVWLREMKVVGVTGRAIEPLPGETEARHDYEHVISLVQKGKMDLSIFPVGIYRQSEYRRAFLDLRSRERSQIVKAVFDFR
ncbi:MAG: alcohol dehydrogenase catalytic domain-containing protein [Phycisphaerae bacterium]|nr:alcohol dehydrogenase catalytic domain-containing protein [Phycisphaerae bacterium]